MKERIEFKVNSKTALKALTDLIVVSFLFIPASLIFVFILPSLLSFLAVILAYSLLYFIPVLYLHSNYENENKGKILILRAGELSYDGQNIAERDIKEINAFGTGASLNLDHYSRLAHMSGYFYVEIKTNNNLNIYLTSLLSHQLIYYVEASFPKTKINKLKKFYPTLKKGN